MIYYYETGRKELFNIREDISEKHDLSVQEPKRVEKLSKELGDYLRSVGGQRPIFKATGQSVPWPDEAFEAGNLADSPWVTTGGVKNGSWRGFNVHESQLNEFRVWVAEPKTPAEGRPLILRIQDFGDGFHCEMNEMLLQAGIYVVAINSYDVCGADYGLNLMDSLYAIARKHFSLPEKCALGCFLVPDFLPIVGRYGIRNGSLVFMVRAGNGFQDLADGLETFCGQLDEVERVLWLCQRPGGSCLSRNPIDNLAPIAKAKIPLRHVISLTDEHDTKIVPNDKNTLKAQRILKQMGHEIDVVVTPEGMKVPYAFDGESVQFILSKTISANKSK